ncbi:MAG: hypothetical protein H0U08_00080 [Actinobacteria bacterium]|nr:hypothetical protein [Actinomycetota bacterium]
MSDYLFEHYFDEPMLSRQRLLWAIATRRQLERWERYVARDMALAFSDGEIDGLESWAAESERHLLLIAARNMLGALDLPPVSTVEIDPTIRADIIAVRDLLEHWKENMPIFNAHPMPKVPSHGSGKGFADRYKRGGPFDAISWSNIDGATVLPSLSAQGLHEIIDAVEGEAVGAHPELAAFIPPRAPSPWRREGGEWLPSVGV